MLNPIQEKIKAGVNPLIAFLSEATCGEACWQAREDICRCSCGGKNHGCLRTPEGTRPVRMAKINGYRYVLRAVGADGLWEEARAINEAAGITFNYASTSRDHCFDHIPAKIRVATDLQVNSWPELTAYRNGKAWTEDSGKKHYIDKPDLLWIKQ